MEYKLSKFNTYLDRAEYLLIYNSYSNEVLKVAQDKDLYNIIKKNEDINKISKENLAKLIKKHIIVSKDTNENLEKRLQINDIVNDNTLVFTMLTTGQCNFRCKYCYEKFEQPVMSDELVESFIKFIKNNITKYNGVHLRWFGGEPLLGLKVIRKVNKEVRKICEGNNRTFSSEMLTNAYLLNLETFEELVDLGVKQYKITIDGCKEIHDNQRVLHDGSGTFDKIMTNLKNIKNNSNKEFRIILRTNISQEALRNLDSFIEMLYKEFGDDKRFNFKFKTVDPLEGTNEDEIKKLKIKNADELFEKLANSKYSLNYNIYYEHLSNGTCRAGKRNNFVLGANGTVYKCLVYFEREENKIGYFNNKGDMILDKAKLALWINNYDSIGKCAECTNSARCPGGKCVASRIFKEKVKCNFSQNHLKNVLKLLDRNGGDKKINKY